MLECVPGRFKVIRHVRPKFACARLRHAGAGAGAVATDCPRPGRSRAARPCAGGQVRRSPAAVSPEPDLCPRGHRPGSLDARRLGRRRRALLRTAGRCARPLRAGAPRSCTPTTRRCRCCARGGARPSKGDCGPTCAMTGRPGARSRRRCGSSTRRIARASIRERICKPSAACCRPMAMPGFNGLYDRTEHPLTKRPAGRTRGASSTMCTRPRRRRWPPRRCADRRALCDRGARSAASRPIERRGDAPGPRWPVLRCAARLAARDAAQLSKKSELAGAIRYASVALGGAHALSRRRPDRDRQQRRRAGAARGGSGPQELAVRRLRCRRRTRRRDLHPARHRQTQRPRSRSLSAPRAQPYHRSPDHRIHELLPWNVAAQLTDSAEKIAA